jgi:ClpP class serine protease
VPYRGVAPIGFPKAPAALAPKYWGADFLTLVFGGAAEKPFEEIGGMAVVDICGALAQHKTPFGDSYDAIDERFSAALDAESPTICLRVNSPGGDFAGCIELARSMRARAKARGKTLIAYTDSTALSAGYALACAGERLYVTPSASVGSIGVWAPMVDTTALDKAMGVAVAIVASDTGKTDSNPHVPISEEALAALQGKVDLMANLFRAHVNATRGVSRDDILSLKGRDLMGSAAVKAGLATNLIDEWFELLDQKPQKKGNSMAKSKTYEALAKAAEEETDEKEKARAKKALAAWDDDTGEGGDLEKKKKEAKASEKEEPPMKEKGKTSAEEEDEKEKEKKEEAKAFARYTKFAAQAKAEESTKAEESKRTELLASRPDFSAELRASLAEEPIAILEKLVKTLPKMGGATQQANASAAMPSFRGAGQGTAQASSEEATLIAGMGNRASAGEFKFGVTYDPDEARKFLEAKNGATK